MQTPIQQHAPDTPDWVADAIFYQIFPDRFASSERVHKPGRLEPWAAPPSQHGFKGGDLLGVVERLDHLEELGINAIYLNPIFSAACNHRYHTFDYMQVDPLLGGNEALRELLDAAHARGMRVILDGVFNHASRGFWPFHHVMETGWQSPYLDWFIIKDFPLRAYDEDAAPNYACWWDLPALPKLNVANPDTRAYLLDVAEYWIRFGADGWRLDVPAEIDDPPFWREFRQRVRAANPEAYTVGEIWYVAPEWLEGDRFDALMNYPLGLTILGFCGRKTVAQEYRPGGYELPRLSAAKALKRLKRLHECYHPNVVRSQLNLLDSHDTPRFLNMVGGDYSAWQLAVLMQMTLAGAPSIYYGGEVGLVGEADPDCRRGFPWNREEWHKPSWDWIREAIALRKATPALRRGSFEPLLGKRGVLAYLRQYEDEAILVVFNARKKESECLIPLPQGFDANTPEDLWRPGAGAGTPRWGRGASAEGPDSPALLVPMAPRSARVLRLAGASA